jgi:hypothetical protein
MSVENLTYGALGARLNISPVAARSLARRLQLPRSLSDDGKALVSVDLAEIKHTPQPSARRQACDVAQWTTMVAALTWRSRSSKQARPVTALISSANASAPDRLMAELAGDRRGHGRQGVTARSRGGRSPADPRPHR